MILCLCPKHASNLHCHSERLLRMEASNFFETCWGNSWIDNWTIILRHQAIFLAPAPRGRASLVSCNCTCWMDCIFQYWGRPSFPKNEQAWTNPPKPKHPHGLCPHHFYTLWLIILALVQSMEKFLECFRNNLIDIGVDPSPYGTHSFRRGGCQYLSSERRWTIRRICEWGGWSTDFTHMMIVKYLMSWNDVPTERREDFFNPMITPTVKCYSCGRTCACAWGSDTYY